MNRHPIIDTHVHFWDMANPDPGLAWVWLEKDFVHPILGDTDAMKSVKYTIESVEAESRFADVSAFVHIQAALGASDPVQETRWLTRMRESAPVPFTIVGHADLGMDVAREQLEGHLESPYFVGVRDFGAEPMLAAGEIVPRYEESLRFLAEKGLVFDLDCEWPQMPAARDLARRHPELTVVLEHIGFPRRRDDEYYENWRRGMAELASAENVVCKISGLAMTDPRFTRESLRRWVASCVELFGPERCVLGSNWPVDRLYSSYDVIMDLYRDYLGELLGEAEQRLVLSDTAARVYRLA